MTTATYTSAVSGSHGGQRPRARRFLDRLVASVRERSERRRQLIALQRLDNRLLEDIGLPPNVRDRSIRLGNSGFAPF